MKTTIYTANQKTGFISEIKQMFFDLNISRELGKRLFIRDLKAEYRQSLLGVVWAFITPLINALVWIFLSATGAINITSDTLPYPLFVFIGTMLWSVFSDSINLPLTVTNSSKALISKINFPKEAILLAGFYKLSFNTSIKIIIMAAAILIFGINPGFNFALGLLMILFIIFFGMSVGLLLAPIGMLYKDIGRALPLILSFLMFTTPVVYQKMKIEALNNIVNYNPLTPLLNSTRNLLTGFPIEQPLYLFAIFIVSCIIGLVGWIFYRVSIPIIVERM